MKKLYFSTKLLAILLLAGFWQSAYSQVSEGGTPPSFVYQLVGDQIDHVVLPAPDVNLLLQEDEANEANKDVIRYGVNIYADLTPENSGTWTDLSDGGKIWRLKISSENALALGLLYKEFKIPVGGKLFVYGKDKKQVIGAFTSKNNPKGEEFANELIKGDELTIEYYQPGKTVENLQLYIHGVNYAYKPIGMVMATKASEWCEVNINCPEGANWQTEKKGVALISIVIGAGSYLCSGSLVNNTAQNCTPYFLSAYHCGEGASASDYNQWVFYFGYEASTCAATTGYYQVSITGATKRAEAINSAGTRSDMLLLELNNSNFGSYVPHYNGWTRATSASTGGVCIHHPAGDIKKISTYTSTLTTYNTTHWLVYWASTVTNHGVTEGGSSGSPLFNNSKLIVGTLTGGSSYCDAPNDPDIYGKFSYHWESNGTTAANQLKPWLDPVPTSATTLTGIDYPCVVSGVTANFSASPTTVVVGGTVNFTDLSSGTISTRNWTFTGGTPSSSTATNPTITYNTAGTYNVSLTVSDGTSSDTETKTAYITVVPAGTAVCDTLRFPLTGTFSIYGASPGGYLAGNNGYGDKAKVDFFNDYAPYTKIEGALIAFAYASGSGNCRVGVWNNSGASGAPGTMIGYKDIPISTIISDVSAGYYTEVVFDSPITIPGNFYLGVVLPTAAGDTVVVYTNDNGESAVNTAWEQWSDNSWYAYDNADSWEMTMSHAISPIVCSDATDVKQFFVDGIRAYPVPSSNTVFVEMDNFTFSNVNFEVFDAFGKLVEKTLSKNISDNKIEIDFTGQPDGIYLVHLQTPAGLVVKKVSIIR
ncbi:MAG: PKD domain-containing protein [Bacteroidales bacterium]|nr:PKD domain-containing protein [Bacteroidales bacterium]